MYNTFISASFVSNICHMTNFHLFQLAWFCFELNLCHITILDGRDKWYNSNVSFTLSQVLCKPFIGTSFQGKCTVGMNLFLNAWENHLLKQVSKLNGIARMKLFLKCCANPLVKQFM